MMNKEYLFGLLILFASEANSQSTVPKKDTLVKHFRAADAADKERPAKDDVVDSMKHHQHSGKGKNDTLPLDDRKPKQELRLPGKK